VGNKRIRGERVENCVRARPTSWDSATRPEGRWHEIAGAASGQNRLASDHAGWLTIGQAHDRFRGRDMSTRNTRHVTSYGQKYLRAWENDRIVYFSGEADPGLWDNRWKNLITRDYYEKYEHGELDELAPFAERLLGKEDRILEAGCGSARLVVSLLSRGFVNVEGMDCGAQTIDRVKAIFPNLPVRVGDVIEIDRRDDYYDGYISLGVVEHRKKGPEPYLHEAWRVLKPGGHAFFSVPYISTLRSLKHRIGLFGRMQGTTSVFYQYAFTKAEFLRILTEAGFEVIGARGVAGYYALQQELPSFLSLVRSIPGGPRVLRYLKGSGWIDHFGHMILFVCRKRRTETTLSAQSRP
jgi:2-polyprenyl-3-methyl-5-hydroxy-6-metoxy-1,4-benzoquinol methylase